MEWFLNRPPLSVQVEAQRRMRGRYGYCLFKEQGLGKTADAMNDFLVSEKRGAVDTLVVIAPNFLKNNWRNEAEEFGFPHKIDVYPNVSKNTKHVAIHIEAIIHSGGEWLEKFMKGKKVYLVIDESSTIKNPQSSRTKMCLRLARMAKFVRCLSGTYAPEGPHEVWPQLIAAKATIQDKKNFIHRFCEKGGFRGKQIIGLREGAEKEYYGLLDQYCFIAKKVDWLDLPEKLHEQMKYELSEEQFKAYVEMSTQMLTKIDLDTVRASQLVTMMLRLQTIGSGFAKSEDGKIIDFANNPKLESIIEHLSTHRRKVVVMYVYNHSGVLLRTAADRAGLRCGSLHGGMKHEAMEVVNRFNGDDFDVLFCQIQVAQYGWTLLGNDQDRCREMVFYENSYSNQTRMQAEDRIHRMGQDKGCSYIDMIGTEQDKKILEALQGKKEMFDSIRQCVLDYSKLNN